MSHINESRKPSGIGYPVLQDHGWPQRGVALEDRASIISVRIKDRKFDSSEFGEYVEDPETRGDWACWLYWDRQSDADRAVGSWSPIFAARVPVELDGDSPPEGAPPPVPSITSPGDRFVQIDITGQDGSSYRIIRNTPKDPPQTRYDMVPEPPIGGQTYDFQRSKARPIGKDNEADERYEEKDVSDTPWGSVPGGTVVAVVGATVEDEQREVVLHGDPRLIAAHRGGPPTLSTSVHDLGPRGDINESRSAPLHSMLRVVPRAAGALSLGAGADVLSWNIGRSGQNDTIGGLVTDQGGLQTRHALVSVRDGGPIDVGDRNDVHYLGTDADGNPINMAHLSTLTLFRGHGGDGPLHIKEEFPASLEERGPWRQRVHCGFDKYLEYQLPRDQPQFTYYGKFSWWTENLVGVENPPTTPGGGIPGDGDPPPTITPGGGDPPPPPPTPGPTTPGGGGSVPGGGSGGGPGTPGGGSPGPSTGGGGGGGSPGTGGGTLGPGPFPLPGQDAPPPLFPGNPPIPNPADRPGFSYSTVTTYHTGMSQDVGGKDTKASTHMEFSSTGLSGRAPLVRDGGKNLSADPSPSLVEFLGWRETSPTTWRALTYGAQEGTGTDPDPMAGQAVAHKYTQEPGKSRSEGGTASGGLAFLPPEVNLTDYASDYAPEGVSRSTAHFVLGPNTKLGFGKPDMGTGGVRTGHTVGGEGGDAVIDRIDSSGTSNEALRLTSEGAAVLGDIASEPSTPTTGAALYSKAGHLYHKHTGGNVTQLTPSNITYVREVSTDTTLTAFDRTVLVDSSAGDVTITLPTGVNGTEYVIKKIYNANTVYVEGTSQQFDRGSILTLDQPQHSVTVKFYSTGTKWYVEHETTWAAVALLFPVIMATDGISTPFASDGYLGFGVSKMVGNPDERHATLAPAAGTIHSLKVEINGSAPGAGSWVLRLYKNGSPTDLTCTITGSNLSASDTSNRVTVAAGDYLTAFLDETGTLSNDMTITFVYEADYQPLFSHGNPVSSISYGDLQSGQFTVGGDDGIATVFPCAGTLKNFAVRCTNCNASGDEVTVTIRKFDTSAGTWSDTALVITLNFDADGSAKVDTSSTLAVAAGDVLQVEYEETGGTVERTSFSCEFWPDVAGDRIVTGCVTTYSITGGAGSFAAAMGANQDDFALSTAFEVNIPSPITGTAQDLYFTTQAQPGGTKWIEATLMENGSDSILTARVTGATRQNSDTSNTVALTAGSDEIGIALTDSNDTPASSTWLAWGFVVR